LGLPIEKDEKGNYKPRGRWNIKIKGERLKPLLATGVISKKVDILNRTVATNFIIEGGEVKGAFAFSIRENKFYVITSRATLVATGGASGIYRANNPVDGAHTTWYCPYNTGAGYAMGIRAGAEMTSFEMRFIALRVKDSIAPTGTLALGFGAKQINSKGEEFLKKRYSHLGGERAPTCIRIYAPIKEVKEGRGPCYLDTRGLTDDRVKELKKAYLDMYPNIVLQWASNSFNPGKEPVEISGTEPYIVGGHCQAGYWIDEERRTTLKGLWAAGDVAGGYPYKFISGCWAEGIIAANSIIENLPEEKKISVNDENEIKRVFLPLDRKGKDGIKPLNMEIRLQKIMDEYAGGISSFYEMNEERLIVARKELLRISEEIDYIVASDEHELNLAHEVIDRIEVAGVLIEHLIYRKETRWPGFQTRLDWPERDDFKWLKFINSYKKDGKIEILERPYKQIIPGDRYLP